MRAGPGTRGLRLALSTALVLALAGAVLVYALAGGGRGGRNDTVAIAGAPPRFDGAPLPATPAPPFTLREAQGVREVSLSSFRGRVVVVTFLYTTCGAPCVLIAQQIRGALDELGGEHRGAPAVLIVSADPRADTPARVESFLAQVALTGRALYLTGPVASLAEVWRAYHVRPASAGARVFAEYASVLVLDPRGRERSLFQSEQLTPEALSHDIGVLEPG